MFHVNEMIVHNMIFRIMNIKILLSQITIENTLQCSSSCGLGNRTRVVTCQGPQGVNENECPQNDRPAEEELCDMGPCSNSKGSYATWLFTEWSQQVKHNISNLLTTYHKLFLKLFL